MQHDSIFIFALTPKAISVLLSNYAEGRTLGHVGGFLRPFEGEVSKLERAVHGHLLPLPCVPVDVLGRVNVGC